jgi:hypothetical protein
LFVCFFFLVSCPRSISDKKISSKCPVGFKMLYRSVAVV